MSLEWGKFRDEYDELKLIMETNREKWVKLEQALNDEINTLKTHKTKYEEEEGRAIQNKKEDTQTKDEKIVERTDINEEYETKCAEFKAKIQEILYTRICATKKTRNALMEYSTTSPPGVIEDCEMDEWIPGDCSVSCDDKCPDIDPAKCGGTREMNRGKVKEPNAFGVQCGFTTETRSCNQFKCAVDCKMSIWGGWSRCTAECDEGTEIHSRHITVEAKNGGEACDDLSKLEPCNSQACDVDCVLEDWSYWSYCDMGCSAGGETGMQTRHKKVQKPAIGLGHCPPPDVCDSDGKNCDTWAELPCNEQKCKGDEYCIAVQDLVLMLDGSGSVKEDGFNVIRNFAVNYTKSMEPSYSEQEKVKLGCVLFGQGELIETSNVIYGTQIPEMGIAPAEMVSHLTFEHESLRTTMMGLAWQKGFTNLAQGFVEAKNVIDQGGRMPAQSAVMVISDGKFSFKFQTELEVKKLKEANIKIFMVPITEDEATCDGKDGDAARTGEPAYLCALRDFATQPWRANYKRIPGLAPLEANMDYFVHMLVVHFCPTVKSPSGEYQSAYQNGYIDIHMGGYPNWKCAKTQKVEDGLSQESCRLASLELGWLAYSWAAADNALQKQSRCYAADMTVTTADWDSWILNNTNVPCADGKWVENVDFNTYVLRPYIKGR